MSAQTNGTGDRHTREQHLEERLLEMEQQGFWRRLFRRGAQPRLSADTTDELLSTGVEAQLAERVGRLYEECRSRKYSHERRSNLFSRMSILFGLPIAIFAAVSGTAAFATLGQQVGTSWRLLVVVLSLAITVMSTTQTYFRFSERATKEQDAANRFSSIQWEIRRWANTTQDRDRASVDSFVNDVLSEMEEADARYRGVEPKRRAVEKAAISAVGQSSAVTQDLLSPTQGLHAAWNAGDAGTILGFFTENATITVTTATDELPQHFIGKEDIRTDFVRKHMHYFQVDSRNYRQDGNRMLWESTISAEKFRQRGINPVEGTAVASFEGEKIASLTFTFSPATQQRMQEIGL
jgi:hypothetical protein